MIELEQARRSYLSHFRESIQRNKDQHEKFASEILLELSDSPNLYRNLFRVDMIYSNEGKNTVLEANIDNPTEFHKKEENYKGTTLSLNPIVWNGIDLTANPKKQIEVESWFLKWADIEDANPSDEDGFGGTIHSLSIENIGDPLTRYSIDFGSARVEALYELIDLLVSGESSLIEICSSHLEIE
ncbi:hypothetical protein MLD52_21650 [Puniceicoccaceae bacterium K14]|nr:hypothetical protein [Puniceicoccaceae bacterium K14]